MAQYFEDFTSSTIGIAPSGWTNRWHPQGGQLTIVEDEEATNGVACRMGPGGSVSSAALATWDILNDDPDRADFEILYRYRNDNIHGTSHSGGVGGRCYGTYNANCYGYTAGSVFTNDSRRVITKLVGPHNNMTTVGSVVSAGVLTVGSYHYARLRVNGDSLKFKAWSGALEDEPAWQVEETDNTYTEPGWIGFARRLMTNSTYYDFIGVGTGGDPAPSTDVSVSAPTNIIPPSITISITDLGWLKLYDWTGDVGAWDSNGGGTITYTWALRKPNGDYVEGGTGTNVGRGDSYDAISSTPLANDYYLEVTATTSAGSTTVTSPRPSTYDQIASGGAQASGTASQTANFAIYSDGGANLGGTATDTLDAATGAIFDELGEGGAQASGSASVSASTIPDYLIGDEYDYWNFEGDSLANIISGRPAFTAFGDVPFSFADNELGFVNEKCVNLTNGYLRTNAKTPAGSFAISLWVKETSPENANGTWYISQRTSINNVGDWQIFRYPLSAGGADDNLKFVMWIDSVSYSLIIKEGALAANAWTHIAVSVDDENKTITSYLDGNQVAQTTYEGTPSTNATAIHLGARGWSHSVGRLNGQMDEIRIFHRPLEFSEIQFLANVPPTNILPPVLSFGVDTWTGQPGAWDSHGGGPITYTWELREAVSHNAIQMGEGAATGPIPPAGNYYLWMQANNTGGTTSAISKTHEHVTAASYIAKLEAVAPLSPNTKRAITELINGLKSDPSPMAGVNNFDAIKSSCLLAGPTTFQQILVPLKGETPVNFEGNFTSDDYSSAWGLKGGGPNSRKYLNTTRSGRTDPFGNSHIAAYITEVVRPTSGNHHIMGSYDKDMRITNTGLQFKINGSAGGFKTRVGYSNLSLYGVMRCEATGFYERHDHSTAYFTHVQRNYNDTYPVKVFTASASVDHTAVTACRIAFYSIGESVDLEALDARLTTYLETLKRGLDYDTADYINRVEAYEGTDLPDYVIAAADELITGCKSDPSPNDGVSNWAAMKAAVLLAGPRTLTGALVPLRGDAPTNNGFTDSDYNPVMGITGSRDTVKNILTSFEARHVSNHNVSLGTYVTRYPEPTGQHEHMVSFTAGGAPGLIRLRSHIGTAEGYLMDATVSPNRVRPENPKPALFGISRVGDQKTIRAYRSILTSIISASYENTSSSPYRLFRWRYDSETITATLSFGWAGEAVDLVALDNRVTTYMIAIDQPYGGTTAKPTAIDNQSYFAIGEGGAITEPTISTYFENNPDIFGGAIIDSTTLDNIIADMIASGGVTASGWIDVFSIYDIQAIAAALASPNGKEVHKIFNQMLQLKSGISTTTPLNSNISTTKPLNSNISTTTPIHMRHP